MTRNILIVGNWRGANEKVIGNSLSTVLLETVRAMNGVSSVPGQRCTGRYSPCSQAFVFISS
jgi:hypothetical protein